MRAAIAVFFLVAGAFGAAARAGTGPGIAPHEATYALTLLEAAPGAETGVEGIYLVRLESGCAAHRIATFLDVHLSNVEGRPVSVEDTYSITESIDGAQLSFATRQSMNGRVVQLIEGDGAMGPAGGLVSFAHPQGRPDLELAPGTVFPFEAMLETLRGLEAGEKGVNQIMFDPSVGEAVMVSDLFIGQPSALSAPPSGDAALLEGEARRTVTAFYALNATDAPPITTAIVDIFRNGVAPRAVFGMGRIKVLAELVAIRRLETPDCR